MKYSKDVQKYAYDKYERTMKLYLVKYYYSFDEFIEHNNFFEEDYKDAVIILRKQKLKKLDESRG